MPSSVEFGAYFTYSPRGQSETSQNSRRVRDAVKRAGEDFLTKAAVKVMDSTAAGGALEGFFHPAAVLVPAPRSAPIAAGYLWPGERIAHALLQVGLGADVRPLLTRTESVPKAAFARPGERPTVARHMETIAVEVELLENPSHIVVVDDVITKGAMLAACTGVLRDTYPEADVRGFALLRTMGLVPDVDKIFDPCVGTIVVNKWGNPERIP